MNYSDLKYLIHILIIWGLFSFTCQAEDGRYDALYWGVNGIHADMTSLFGFQFDDDDANVISAAEEYKLKAAYIFHFTNYISWKDSQFNPEFIIGVMGKSPIYHYLIELSQEKTINSKIIVVDKYYLNDFTRSFIISYCDILFVPESSGSMVGKIVEEADNHTLLIGESEYFAKKGGAINFFINDGFLRFQINVDALIRAGITIDTQLLKIAELHYRR